MIRQIMTHEVFREQPPVLVDVGASGEVHKEWSAVAPFSICIAFDGDDRELKSIRSSGKGYRELILYHRVLSAAKGENTDFYLTASPYCSSTLAPDEKGVAPYSFSPFFEVEKKVQLKSVTLDEVLEENNLDYVDWFKTDSQGTDLRLFASLPEKIAENVKIAEFEPGIIDAYCGEDKFYHLLEWMNGKDFFLDAMACEGVYRIHPETLERCGLPPEVWRYMKKTPGWVNLTFLNTGRRRETWSLRDALFFTACCFIRKQYGMALESALCFRERFPEEKLFAAAEAAALKKLKKTPLSLLTGAVKRKLAAFILSHLD